MSALWQTKTTTTGLPWISLGNQGAGGASRSTATHVDLARCPGRERRGRTSSTSCASSARQAIAPPRISGPTGKRLYSNEVTMPKLPPPPRSAQKSSGFSSALARTMLALGGHDLDRGEVVAGPAEAARQVAEAAAEREPGDAGRRDEAEHRREAVELGLAVEVAERAAGLGARGPRRGVDRHAAHEREVDHQAAVADGEAGDVVAAAAHRDQELMVARAKRTAGTTSAVPSAAHDQARAPVDHRVPDPARLVVVGVLRAEHGAAESAPEGLQDLRRDLHGAAVGDFEFDRHGVIL